MKNRRAIYIEIYSKIFHRTTLRFFGFYFLFTTFNNFITFASKTEIDGQTFEIHFKKRIKISVKVFEENRVSLFCLFFVEVDRDECKIEAGLF